MLKLLLAKFSLYLHVCRLRNAPINLGFRKGRAGAFVCKDDTVVSMGKLWNEKTGIEGTEEYAEGLKCSSWNTAQNLKSVKV